MEGLIIIIGALVGALLIKIVLLLMDIRTEIKISNIWLDQTYGKK